MTAAPHRARRLRFDPRLVLALAVLLPAGAPSAVAQAAASSAAAEEAPPADPQGSWLDGLDAVLRRVVGAMETVLFFDPIRPFLVRDLPPSEETEIEALLAPLKEAATAGAAAGASDGLMEAEREETLERLAQVRDRFGPSALPYLESLRDELAAEAKARGKAPRTEAILEEVKKTIPRVYTPARLVVLWLIFGALAFTFIMRFINFRAFRHSLDVIAGKYDNPADHGEVSHFQALCAALSATVGLGNIAGVAVAVVIGGPGAVLWMVVSAFFGMTSKFVECTLGQKYRRIDEHGRVSGGAMQYLSAGLAELGVAPLGKVLAVLFAVLCIGASFGGGNMFQVNQSYEAIETTLLDLELIERGGALDEHGAAIYGVAMAVLVGLVIIGGIRRIAATAGRIVPFMCAVYVLGCLYIIVTNLTAIPAAVATIVQGAFDPAAIGGGFLGVLLVGVQRAAFSNEAGIGSAAIAHSAARTEEPVREGIVALLEPFVDTVIVCTMTGLAVVVSGAYAAPEFQTSGVNGAAVTAKAFSTIASWFPLILSLATMLFAYSTMISWSYYGERCWTYIFGPASTLVYKLIFLVFIVVGAVAKLGVVLDFSDMMLLGMAFPNLLGCLLLSGKVRRDLASYWSRYKSGQMKRYA